MEHEPAHDLRPAAQRPVVAFDFDGTLTTHDSFLAFLAWRKGVAGLARGAPALAPAALRYLADRDRGRLKGAAVRVYLGGLTANALAADADRFADRFAARLLRPDALDAFNRWKRQGARILIVTASPELIIGAFGRRLGAEAVIGTRLALDAEGRIAGGLVGENCRGPEKVRRIQAALGDGVRLAAAYGDTRGDREMLEIADSPGYRVFTGRPDPAR